MKAIRKLIVAAVACAALWVPHTGSKTPQAEAGPTHSHSRTYRIYVRNCVHSSWRYVGATTNYKEAQAFCTFLRRHRLETYIY